MEEREEMSYPESNCNFGEGSEELS